MSIYSVAGVLIGHEINKARFERYIFAESAINLADIQKKYNEDLEKEGTACHTSGVYIFLCSDDLSSAARVPFLGYTQK